MDAALARITDRVRAAAAQRSPLRIAGGGSKGFHPASRASAPVEALEMRECAGILNYEPSELVITARAGTPLAEVEALLAEHGQCLAFEPPHFADPAPPARGDPGGIGDGMGDAGNAGDRVDTDGKGSAGGEADTAGAAGNGPAARSARGAATLGGAVAAGLSGPARASVGALRDFVLGAEIVNGRGELLRFGGQVMKNVAGYDVSRLMAGSWGRLAAITEVSLKVLPAAPAEATLRFECSQREALTRLHAWGGQPLPLNASCWVQEDGRMDADGDAPGLLYVRLRGAHAAVQAACRSMGGEPQTAASAAQDWQDCRDQRLPWFSARPAQLALWRLSLPQTAPALPLPAGVAAPLVEWHGALRWVQAAPEHGAQLAALARQAGGSTILFRAAHASGTSGSGLFDLQDATLAAIHRRLLQAFDPAGIFCFDAPG